MCTKFTPSPQLTATFKRLSNGTGLDWLALWLTRQLLDTNWAEELLRESVEGGFMATFQARCTPGVEPAELPDTALPALKQAIFKRIPNPRIPIERKEEMALDLLIQTIEWLELGNELILDDVAVHMTGNGRDTPLRFVARYL